MPELPEVETIRRGLARHLVGKTVAEADIYHPRAVRRQEGGDSVFRAEVTGTQIVAVARRGKYLWFELATGKALVAHLGMSGQLLVQEAEGVATAAHPDPKPWLGSGPDLTAGQVERIQNDSTVAADAGVRHQRAKLRFTDGTILRFIDQRTFGHLCVSPEIATPDGRAGGTGTDTAAVPQLLAHVARDLLDPATERDQIIALFRKSSSEIKRLLLDQRKISGIGNIYADEALFRARVHPQLPGRSLSEKALAQLLQAAAEVQQEALAVGGTSFDALYVDVAGAPGFFARQLAVYGRAGQRCPICGAAIERLAFMGRSSHFCPNCQSSAENRGIGAAE